MGECYASLKHTEAEGISHRGTLRFMSATPQPNALLVIAADAGLYAHLQRLASAQRCVFFAGLPGTGKSLLSHQLTHLAHALGRTVHMLQWDVARPVFEASAAGQRYPVVQGVTHGVIRKAAGLWARQAVVQWHQRYPEAGHLLIGETPFVGHRFIELARQRADAAEPLLRTACFVRSEEHTSELQSPYDLVCRLLLEKKKIIITTLVV